MNKNPQLVLSVNGSPIDCERLRLQVFFESQEQILETLIEDALIENEFRALGLSVDIEEVAQEASFFRRTKKLFSADETREWLDERLIDEQSFQEVMTGKVKRKKLRQLLAIDKVEKLFSMQRWRFDTAVLYLIKVNNESAAEELRVQIDEGSCFFALAKEYSSDKASAPACGYLGSVRRETLRPEIESAVFNAAPGSVVGPIASIDGYHLYLIENIIHSELTEEISLEIEEQILKLWLKENKDLAEIVHHASGMAPDSSVVVDEFSSAMVDCANPAKERVRA